MGKLIGMLGSSFGPYILGGLGILILSMLAAIGYLWEQRDLKIAENATLKHTVAQAALTNRDNIESISYLQADIEWRSERAIIRQRRERQAKEDLAVVRGKLQEAMADAPECVYQPWPDDVFNIMRRGTVLDPDRSAADVSAGGVPAADSDPRTQGQPD